MRITSLKKNQIFFVIPLLGALLVLFATRFGPGITPDSVFYISAADALTKTGELRSIYEGAHWEYLTHYPPGYPCLLAAFNSFTGDVYEAARWINAFSLFGFLALIPFLVKRHLKPIYIVCTQVLLLVNLSFFGIYEMAWSEAPFLFFATAGLSTLQLFVERSNVRWLILSGTLVSIAVSVRYVGVTLIPASLLYLWLQPVQLPQRSERQ